MEKYRGNQYDDDLTVGLDDIADESFDTGYVDLFEYGDEQESPISRLKTLMLSIEWEITDKILIDFNDELLRAQQEWAEDSVKLVYIQALQKISKYIYQKKADAHHNAMKVLIAFFYDLEKIVLDTRISEEEKRDILLGDVKKFERLKQQIGLAPRPKAEPVAEVPIEFGVVEPERDIPDYAEVNPDLYNLKAYILSIDWEITDKELTEISREVKHLQSRWSSSRPHKILLQGIDAIGGYIKLMKSASHADAFKLLNSFYLALETIVEGRLGYQETKNLLISEAGKFNRFKEEIADSITPEAIARYKEQRDADAFESVEPLPPEDEDAEAFAFEDTSEFEQTSIAEDIGGDEGFSEETLEKVASFFGEVEAEEPSAFATLSSEEALRGVEVETEADDDTDEEALPTLDDGKIAPALADIEADAEFDFDAGAAPASFVPGVDVETEADDESDEAPLPLADGELAPALFASDETGDLPAAAVTHERSEGADDISQKVDDFFASKESAIPPALSEYQSAAEVEEVDNDADTSDVEDSLESFLAEDSGIVDSRPISDERFAALKTKIDSLRDEIDQEKTAEIQAELETFKDLLADKPIEKTLTHLISTVVQNIGKDSGESDDEAVELLHSVFANLERIRISAVDQYQSLITLSNETAKILQWQQRMLKR